MKRIDKIARFRFWLNNTRRPKRNGGNRLRQADNLRLIVKRLHRERITYRRGHAPLTHQGAIARNITAFTRQLKELSQCE